MQAQLAQLLSQNPDSPIAQAVAAGQIQQAFTPQAAPKPPQSRTRIEGNETVFEQFDPSQNKFVEVSRGPRNKPETNVTVNTGEKPLDKTLVKDLQSTILKTDTQLDLLNDLGTQFDKDFLTVAGDIKAGVLTVSEKLGRDLSDTERAFITDRTTFLANTAENLNAYINAMSGAAVSEQEAKRLAIAQPTGDDSPTEYLAKLDNRIDRLNIARVRANLALELGITGIGEIESLSALTSESFERRLDKEAEKWGRDFMKAGS